jgi:hypothetical protein
VTFPANILGDADVGGWIELLIFLGFLVISGVTAIIRKAMEKRADEEELQERRQQQPQARQATQQQPERRYRPIPPREVSTPTAAPRRQPPPRPQPQAGRVQRPEVPRALQAARAARQREAQARQRQAQARKLQQQRQDIRRQKQQQARLQQQQAQRQRQAVAGKRAARSASPRHLAKLRGLTGLGGRRTSRPGQGTAAKGFVVRLAGSADARRAMVYHEIFSRPKALRRGPELWDM